MATITFFFLLTLTLSSTIHATRESQFFNKFPNKEPQLLNTNQQSQPQPQPQPTFIPQSQDSDSSYGLYGQLPPSTTTNNNLPEYLPENYNPVAYTTPIHSTTQDIPNEFNSPQTHNNNMYNSEKHGMSETRFTDNNMYNSQNNQGFDDASFMETEDDGGMYNSEKRVENGRYNSQMHGMNSNFMETEDDGGMYNSEKRVDNGRYNSQMHGMNNNFMETEDDGGMYNSEKRMDNGRYNSHMHGMMNGNNGGDVYYNTKKQGMSDTRFLENGKYFYDVNMENLNSNPNMNTRGYRSSYDRYNTQGYYGKNGYNGNSYDRFNSGNSYDRYNSNGGYQNQEYRFNP